MGHQVRTPLRVERVGCRFTLADGTVIGTHDAFDIDCLSCYVRNGGGDD